MNRDEDVRRLFESATVRSRPEEREAILEAAKPRLRELAEEAGAKRSAGEASAASPVASSTGRPPFVAALRWLLRPSRLAFAAAFAVVLAVFLVDRPPATLEPRSAAIQSWAEHVAESTGEPFALAAATFGRPY